MGKLLGSLLVLLQLKVIVIVMPVLHTLLTRDEKQYFQSTVGNPWMPRAEYMHVLHFI